MKSLSALKAAAVFLLLVALHYTVRPLIGARISVDFLVIAVLVTAVHLRPGIAAVLGFAFGLVTDSLSPLAFGAGAFALSTIGFAASWLKAAVFGDNMLLQAIFVAAGKWAFDLLYVVVEQRLSGSGLLMQLLVWSPLSAVLTGIVGVLVVMTFRLSMESRP